VLRTGSGVSTILTVKPDLKLVYDAETIITADNMHIVQTCLNWYKHWCAVGNVAGAHTSADVLRGEIAKVRKKNRSSKKKE
jgi:hypothetical protein